MLLREPNSADQNSFLILVEQSQELHHPWVKAPSNSQEFAEYLQRSQLPNQKSYFACDQENNILGVFNISEIVRGSFHNAYLGFYSFARFSGKGYMSESLRLVLDKVFNELALHRIEANIQPGNERSIQLVKRNGFRLEGFSLRYLHINGEWRDHERWAMTVEDFK